MNSIVSGKIVFRKSDASSYGKWLMARSLYSKGKSFIAAAVLLDRQEGAHRYVVLHLICQGTEIILKSLLLLLDYDRYSTQQRNFGHDLLAIAEAARVAFNLKPMKPALEHELKSLNGFYSKHALRYDGLQDIFIDPATIESNRVLRRVAALIRLTEREISRNEDRTRSTDADSPQQ